MAQALFYSSNAVAMTLAGGMLSGDTSCTLSSSSGLPASFPFKLLIGWGTGQQEVVHCTALSGVVATITRGQDGTTAQAHSVGATVVHGVSAREFNDLELHVGSASGVHGLAGAVVGTTDTQVLTNKTLNGATIDAASTIGGVTGTALAADRVAWTSYTPVWSATTTAPTLGNGTKSGAYKQIGKTVYFRININCGTTTNFGVGILQFGLPVSPVDFAVGIIGWCTGSAGNESFAGLYDGSGVGGQAVVFLVDGTANLTNGNPRLAANQRIVVAGSYEAA